MLAVKNRLKQAATKTNYLVVVTALAALSGLVFMTVFVSGQQIIRGQANSMPRWVAHEVASEFADGSDPSSLLGATKTDVSNRGSLAISVYDRNHNLITSNAALDGEVPLIPGGVLEHATADKDNAITWQPVKGVRLAAVVVFTEKGYVVATNNLADAENQITHLLIINSLAFLGSLALIIIAAAAYRRISKS